MFFLFQPGSDLAAELGVTAQDDVLFAVFSTPDPSEGMLFFLWVLSPKVPIEH